jgi:ketosteroid isomerase-like protein
MSNENVELVRTVLEAWNRQDLESVGEFIAKDIEWLEVGGVPERADTEIQGRATVRAGFDSLFDAWQSYWLEPEDVFDVDDRVVAILREVARGRTSGLEVASRWGYVITVRDGKLTRVESYRDPREALDAAGVPKRDPRRARV